MTRKKLPLCKCGARTHSGVCSECRRAHEKKNPLPKVHGHGPPMQPVVPRVVREPWEARYLRGSAGRERALHWLMSI